MQEKYSHDWTDGSKYAFKVLYEQSCLLQQLQ